MFRFGDPGGYPYGIAANILTWWSGESHFTAGGGESIVTNGSRLGVTNALRLTVGSNTSGGNWCYIWKSLDNQATYGIALAFKTNNLVSTPIIIFQDGGTDQVDVRLGSDGSLTATRNGTSLGAAPAGTVVLNTWVHIEFKATINNTTGTIYLGINGAQVLNLTAQNTRTSANNYANTIYIGPSNPPFNTGMTCDFCDIIVYDGQSTDANGNADITGPIGDCSLSWLQPNGIGATTNFTPIGSANNYSCVNESTPDGDTSYVNDSNVGDIDTYSTADIALSTSVVKSVALVHYARKDDSGNRILSPALRISGTNYFHTNQIPLGTSYAYFFNNWGSDPSTTSAFTKSIINAIEIGQKVAS